MAMIKWIVTTAATYDALGTKDANALYWLSDTKEIYKGAISFSESVVFYETTLPTRGARGKVYLEKTTMVGSVWDGTAWKTVIKAISDTVMDGASPTTKGVSGVAVKAYVDGLNLAKAADVVTDITYDSTNKAISFTRNGAANSLPITKLGATMDYDGATGNLVLKDTEGTALKTINIPVDNFVTTGAYDDATNSMVLTLRSGGTVTIPAADLVKIYDGIDTDTIDITIATETGNNIIRANVKISATANNAVEAKTDGLFVDKEALLKIGETTAAGNVVTLDANGHAADSTVALSSLATKAYADGIKTTLETNLVAKSDIVASAAGINETTPSATKVISEAALVQTLAWTTL